MAEPTQLLRLTPGAVLRLGLGHAPPPRRAVIRMLLLASAGTLAVEGAERIAGAPRPSIFVLSHHNLWEAVLAPTALVALRDGAAVRFLVDWMYAEAPVTSWLVRQIDPIPVWRKRARFGWNERLRLSRASRDPLVEAAATLTRGIDVGLYPEGTRNRDPGRLAPLRSGLAHLALATGVPIVPVGVELPAHGRLGRVPRLSRVVLRAGEPLVFDAEQSAARDGGSAARRARRAVIDRVSAVLSELSRKTPTAAPGRHQEMPMSIQSASSLRPARRSELQVHVAQTPRDRSDACAVIAEVYRDEKRWIADVQEEVAAQAGPGGPVIWLLARAGDEPVGVLRLVVDPELALPEGAGLQLEPGVDLVQLGGSGRFAEVGRLMVRRQWRRRPATVLALMRAALREVVDRGCTHLLTTVFETDPHSPYDFHMRRLGFRRIGTFETGELACSSRRILLVVEIAEAWARVGADRRGVAAALALGLEARLSAGERAVAAS